MRLNILFSGHDTTVSEISGIIERTLTMPPSLSVNTRKASLNKSIEIFCWERGCHSFTPILSFTSISFILYYLLSLILLPYKILIGLAWSGARLSDCI